MLYMQHTFPLKVIDLSIRLMCILLIKSFSNWWKNISRKQYDKIDTFAYAHAIIIIIIRKIPLDCLTKINTTKQSSFKTSNRIKTLNH